LAGILATLAFPALAAAAPFLLLAAAILAVGSAIGLIVDDITNFIDGNESLLGSILESWPIIGEMASWIVEQWKIASDFIFSSIDEMKKIWDGVKNMFGFGDSEVSVNANSIDENPNSDISSGESKKSGMEQVIFEGKKAVGLADIPLSAMSSNSITNSSSVYSQQDSSAPSVQIGEIVIETQATDHDGIAAGIKQSLGDQLRGLSARYDNAIAR
jgi:hypothetical protein